MTDGESTPTGESRRDGTRRATDPPVPRGPSTTTVLGVLGLFLSVQLGALAFAVPFTGGGSGAVANPGDPTFGVVYLVGMLVVSGLLLLAVRRGATWVLRGFAVFSSGLLSWFVLASLLPPLGADAVGSLAAVHVPAAATAAALVVALVVHPEWYVINLVGVLTGAGAAGLVGVTLGVLPILVLLVALAAYDAVAVYGTGHMGTLAGGAVESRAPVMFVVPGDRSFSYLDGDDETTEEDGGRPPRRPDGGTTAPSVPTPGGALFVGIGDAVLPTTLAVSAVAYLPAPLFDLPAVALSLPAVGALVGTLAGLGLLLVAVDGGRAHAGLPPLNGGAIVGYLVGSLVAGVPLAEALGLAAYL
jgi:presenilin-like A22 family membrane protease